MAGRTHSRQRRNTAEFVVTGIPTPITSLTGAIEYIFMLSIRQEQLEAFQPVADRVFVENLIEALKEQYPGIIVRLSIGTFGIEQLPDDTLHKMVLNGITRARGYGMSWESSLSGFVILMFVMAPNFDEHPLIKRVLKNDSVAPDSRIEQLWEHTSDENWEAVEQNYDANAWNI